MTVLGPLKSEQVDARQERVAAEQLLLVTVKFVINHVVGNFI